MDYYLINRLLLLLLFLVKIKKFLFEMRKSSFSLY